MSGLLQYFMGFMPNKPHIEEEDAYKTSLLDSATRQGAAQNDPNRALEINDEELDCTMDPLDYKGWKKERNRKLLKFFEKRLCPPRDDSASNSFSSGSETELEEDDEDQEENSPNDKDEDSPPASLMFDTQQPQHEGPDSQEPLANTNHSKEKKSTKKNPTPIIPYVKDTVHTLSRLEDIDLYTKEASIHLALITKVFGKRSLKRYAVTKDVYGKRHLPILGSKTTLPHIANAPFQCDGPLATIYNKSVLSVDVAQLDLEPVHPARRAAAAADTEQSQATSTLHQTTRMFFYDQYADALDLILQDYDPKKHTLLVELQNVTAESVLPYSNGDWNDPADGICICFGGYSTMKIVDGEKARFDNPGLRIRIAMGMTGSDSAEIAFREWFLRLDGDEGVVLEDVDNSVLAPKCQQWKRMWGYAQEEKQQETQDDSNKENETTAVAAVTQAKEPAEDTSKAVAEKRVAVNAANSHSVNEETNDQEKATEMETLKTDKDPTAPARKEQATTTESASTETQATNTGEAVGAQKMQVEVQNDSARDTVKEAAKPVATDSQTAPTGNQKASENRVQQNQEMPKKAQNTRLATVPPPEEPTAKRSKSYCTYSVLNELRALIENHRNQRIQNSAPVIGKINTNKYDIHCEANLFALVTAFSAPSTTAIGDFKVNVTLVDQALLEAGDTSASVTLVIFTKHKSQLPNLKRAGDVLRMHRVVVQEFNGELQLRGQRSTSYVVYRGGEASAEEKVAFACKSSWNEQDEEKCSDLWEWGQGWLTNHPTIKVSEKRTLSQMRQQLDDGKSEDAEPALVGDLTVMVTAILPMPPDLISGITPMGFIRVWDGSGISHSDKFAISVPTGRAFDPPAEALVAISKIKEHREGFPALPTAERLCGRVVNVAIWEEFHWDVLAKANVKVGDFLRLRNVNENFLKEVGLNCLMVGPHSWLTPLPPSTYEILELLQNHGERVAQKHEINPSSGVLPLASSSDASNRAPAPEFDNAGSGNQVNRTTSRPAAPAVPENQRNRPIAFTTLRTLRTGPYNSTFSGIVVVRAIFPSIRNPGEMVNVCPVNRETNRRNYRVGLRLKDETTRLETVATERAAEQFFGIPARDACQNGADAAFSVLSCIEERQKFNVQIKSLRVGENKFFVLTSITPVRD